ncbi:MAG TPA: IMP dehydrogenase [candidate division Zixibacteria bacterium]|nr:IMP dehydrogenase [candidate division Zixibacteria bacterium]HBZ00886.1 IMP dehydrogenase [candidate division Zixibacteria bacterium]
MDIKEALTFDDVLLVPAKSSVLPRDASIVTKLTKDIVLNVPIVSAAMDTVTESAMAIALARQGGIGIVHKNLSIEDQASEVDKVKRSESGMIVDPITLPPDALIGQAWDTMKKFSISGIPITQNGKLVGILTNRDLRFHSNPMVPIAEVMTKENLVTVPEGTDLDSAKELLHKHRIEKLLMIDSEGNLKGMITVKDILKRIQYPNACKDSRGRLRVGAAVGVTGDMLERATALLSAGVDILAVDSSHGHSEGVLIGIERLRKAFPEAGIIGGNVGTAEGAADLIKAGVSAVKVGVGPGSICTTRVVTGAGMPQITAIMECASVCEKHNIPLVADGGIKYSGDITKALAAGADSVMIGSLLAGTEESPGETILFEGRSYKVYQGMGSIEAMRRGSADRYFQQTESGKMVPEGIVGRVPYKGPVGDSIYQLIGGLRAGMGICGAKDIPTLKKTAKFIRITNAGLRESHPHDVKIIKEAPNYRTLD